MEQLNSSIKYRGHNASHFSELEWRTLHLHLLAFNGQVRFFRRYWGLPCRGQKTWRNAKTSQSLKMSSLQTRTTLYSNLNIFSPSTLELEYVNLFWLQQWYHEWYSNTIAISKLPLFVRKQRYIDARSLRAFYVYNAYVNPFKRIKKIKHRRKRVTPKNTYTTGFKCGFTKFYSDKLNTI